MRLGYGEYSIIEENLDFVDIPDLLELCDKNGKFLKIKDVSARYKKKDSISLSKQFALDQMFRDLEESYCE